MKLTPSQYATARGITTQAVTKRIREGKDLPGVKKVLNYGRFYLLVMDKKQNPG